MKKYISIIILLTIICSCSFFPQTITRNVPIFSICWVDDDNFLIYSEVKSWRETNILSMSETGYVEWCRGEIWKVNASTGEKEKVFEAKGDKYYANKWSTALSLSGNQVLISINENCYTSTDYSSYWKEYEGLKCGKWKDDNHFVAVDEETRVVEIESESGEKNIIYNGENLNYDLLSFDYNNRTNGFVITDLNTLIIHCNNKERKFVRPDTIECISNSDTQKIYALEYKYGFTYGTDTTIVLCEKADGDSGVHAILLFDEEINCFKQISIENSRDITPDKKGKYLISWNPLDESITLRVYDWNKTFLRKIYFDKSNL